MEKIYNNLTELVGNTPLMRLASFEEATEAKAEIVAKLECFNPLSSVKDRVGVKLVRDALEKGEINAETLIIEPTSGNTGIGICLAAAVYGLHAVIVMPDSMSIERRRVMAQLGANVVLTNGALGMKGAIEEAERLKAESGNAVILGQFTNSANPMAHYETTGPEIYRDTNGKIDLFVAGVGTGGTITGVGRYLKQQNKDIKIVAVEPFESPVLTKGYAGAHIIQGIGANFAPENFDSAVADEIIDVLGSDAVLAAKLLAKTEGVLCGYSSGAALSAAVTLSKRPEYAGKRIVVLLPDGGDRYTSTSLFD